MFFPSNWDQQNFEGVYSKTIDCVKNPPCLAFHSELKARVVAYNWNPSTLEGEGEGSQVPGHCETPPPNKKTKEEKRERQTGKVVVVGIE